MWFCYMLVSIFSAFGLSILLVEKGRTWPVRRYRLILEFVVLPLIHRRLPKMLNCVICTSFWATLVTDSLLYFFTNYSYWCWPLSGFITVGFTWMILKILEINSNLSHIAFGLTEIADNVKKDGKDEE